MSDNRFAIRQYARFLARHGWLIVLVPLLAVAGGALFVRQQTSVYRASTGIFVAQAGGSAVPQLGNLPLTQTMSNILESQVLATQVTRQLDFQLSPSHLLKKLGVQVNPDSSVVVVTYDSANKQRALQVLNAYVGAFTNLVEQQLGVSGTLNQGGPLHIIVRDLDPPHLVPGRVSPKPAQVLAFAAGLGLLLGLILAFVRNALDDRLRGRAEAEEWFGAPVIGVLPAALCGSQSSAESGVSPSPAVEALDLLGANVQLFAADTGPALLVSSPPDTDDASSVLTKLDASSVLTKLAVMLVRAGQDVILVETDGHRSQLRRLLGMPRDSADSDDGLRAVLAGKIDATDALREVRLGPSFNAEVSFAATAEGRLMLLPCGAPSQWAAVASPEGLRELVSQLSARANFVFFDCPQVLSVAHGLALASVVDGVLVVLRDGHTRRGHAEMLRTALGGLAIPKVAVVLIERRRLVRIRAASIPPRDDMEWPKHSATRVVGGASSSHRKTDPKD